VCLDHVKAGFQTACGVGGRAEYVALVRRRLAARPLFTAMPWLPSTLAMADTGPHPAFLLPKFAAALARFLDSHAVLQSVTDPVCLETL